MPTGFVKSTIQAPGAARSRTRSAIPSTTGTVRRAFAKPPAPVVSWPMHPQASGTVSSERRASARRPDLDQDEVRPVERAVEVARHGERAVVLPSSAASGRRARRRSRGAARRCRAARALRWAGAHVHGRGRTRAPACRSSRLRDRHLSSFHPRQRDALDEGLLGQEEDDDHRQHHQHRRRHRQVPLHLVQLSLNCERPIDVTQLSGFSDRYSSGRKKSFHV